MHRNTSIIFKDRYHGNIISKGIVQRFTLQVSPLLVYIIHCIHHHSINEEIFFEKHFQFSMSRLHQYPRYLKLNKKRDCLQVTITATALHHATPHSLKLAMAV